MEDNGYGMTPEYLEIIFDAFTRATTGTFSGSSSRSARAAGRPQLSQSSRASWQSPRGGGGV